MKRSLCDNFAVDLSDLFPDGRQPRLSTLVIMLRLQKLWGTNEPAFQEAPDYGMGADRISVGYVKQRLDPTEHWGPDSPATVTDIDQGHRQYGNWTLLFDKRGKTIALTASRGEADWCLLMTFADVATLQTALDALWPELESETARDPDYCPSIARKIQEQSPILNKRVVGYSGIAVGLGAA